MLCFAMAVGFVGCKKAPDDDSQYSIVYEYRHASGDQTAADGEKDSSKKDGSNSASTKKDGSNSASTGKGTSTTSNGKNAGTSTGKGGSKNTGGKTIVMDDNTSRPTVVDIDASLDNDRIRDLKGREIVFVQTWEPTDRGSAAGKFFIEVEQKLNCRFTEKKMSDYKALYTSILAGQPLCDLFCPRDQQVLQMANKNLLTPLDTLKSFDLSEPCWDQQALMEATLKGHVYGISRNAQIREVLMYNKDMFKKNNWPDLYDLQKKGKLDWDTLFGIMKKAVVVSGGQVSRYGLVPTYSISEFGNTMLHANGVTITKRQGDTTKLTNGFSGSAAINALNALNKWVSEKGALYDNQIGGWDSGRQIFYSGKAAMALVDYNMFPTITSNADFEIGMVLFPHGPNTTKDLVYHFTTYTCMPAGVKNPDDVALYWDILRNSMNESAANWSGGDSLPDKSVQATADRYLATVQKRQAVYDLLIGAGDYVKKVAYGEATASAAIQSVKQTIDAALADYWK